MAEVFDYAEGRGSKKSRKLERVVALHHEVQHTLDREVQSAFHKAEERLAEHRKTGNASVGVEEGDVDRYLFLEDPPAWEHGYGESEWYTQGAALAIEMRLNIIRRAAGMK
jgi:hypothetical protein